MKHWNLGLILSLIMLFSSCQKEVNYALFPTNGATEVNPDVQLKLVFNNKPTLGNEGFIRIYEAETGRLVDSLDLSIPAGPTEPDTVRKRKAQYTPEPYQYYPSTNFTNANTRPGTPSGLAQADTIPYQLTIIGGFTDGFHFHPVIIRDSLVTIYPHHNLLEYNTEYYVTIDPGVLTTEGNSFRGITSPTAWRFKTKEKAPSPELRKLVVSADGTGDFNTVQGAMDFIPDCHDVTPISDEEPYEVFIRNGNYEELVYFRNKWHVTLRGESREGVVIHYANNETFNPHPLNLKTNEWPGTFPSRRAAFAMDNCHKIHLENLTIQTTLKGQAEGLLIMGWENSLKNVHVIGSGDALQANGSVYLEGCRIDGDGDTVLGRGPAFFKKCTLSSYGPFMWIRNTSHNHGNVFVECTFLGQGEGAVIARSPVNRGTGYPYAESVLINCTLDNIAPEGWGTISGDTSNLHFWEYNSRDLNGDPIDVSKRHPLSRQLDGKKDKKLIEYYSNPKRVLGSMENGKWKVENGKR